MRRWGYITQAISSPCPLYSVATEILCKTTHEKETAFTMKYCEHFIFKAKHEHRLGVRAKESSLSLFFFMFQHHHLHRRRRLLRPCNVVTLFSFAGHDSEFRSLAQLLIPFVKKKVSFRPCRVSFLLIRLRFLQVDAFLFFFHSKINATYVQPLLKIQKHYHSFIAMVMLGWLQLHALHCCRFRSTAAANRHFYFHFVHHNCAIIELHGVIHEEWERVG